MITSVFTYSDSETEDFACNLARQLPGGSVILLFGELGVGKTVFVKGLVRGVQGNPDEVTSPTFTLIQEYKGPTTLYHVDLYRLEKREVDDLGLEELMREKTFVAIEWADKLPRPIEDSVKISIYDKGEQQRKITIET